MERQICDLLVSRWRGEGCGWGADPREGSSDWIHACTSPAELRARPHIGGLTELVHGLYLQRAVFTPFPNLSVIGSSSASEGIAETVEIMKYENGGACKKAQDYIKRALSKESVGVKHEEMRPLSDDRYKT